MKLFSVLKYVGIIGLLLAVTFISFNLLSVNAEAGPASVSITGKGTPGAQSETSKSGSTVVRYGCEGTGSCTITVNFSDTK